MQTNDVLKCRHIVIALNTEKICDLLLKKWNILDEIHKVLKPLYQATIVMQTRDFTLSDFYASWCQVEQKLKKYSKKQWSTNLVKKVMESMTARKHKLMDNPAMLCALLLDPRFCHEPDEEQKEIAMNTLETVWKKNHSLKRMNQCASSIEISDSESSDDDISIQTTTNLKMFMDRKIASLPDPKQALIKNTLELRDKLKSFIEHDHQVAEGTIYDFWFKSENDFPELISLAEIIYAMSPTQVVVERAFSTLNHIFGPLRNQINNQLLEDILVICLNEDLFEIVNQDDITELILNG